MSGSMSPPLLGRAHPVGALLSCDVAGVADWTASPTGVTGLAREPPLDRGDDATHASLERAPAAAPGWQGAVQR
jgi:hypothetical protein